MKQKLKRNLWNYGPRLKFNLEKLRYTQVADMFGVTIGGKFAALNLLEEIIENLTENNHRVLIESASQVLGKRRRDSRRHH